MRGVRLENGGKKTFDPVEVRGGHQPLMSWDPEGNCFEGITPHLTDDFLFVESNSMVLVGETITVRLIQRDSSRANSWDVAEGTVVWHCPSEDLFKNLRRFGVHLNGNWRRPLASSGAGSGKEAA